MQKVLNILRKLHLKEVLAILFILVGIYFFRQQREELKNLIPSLQRSNPFWIVIGLAVTVLYILLQSAMYVYSFETAKSKISLRLSIELFLKRNFLSVFLPAGGVTALAYMPQSLRRANLHKKETHQASAIYGFIGILSVFIVGVPVVIYTLTQSSYNSGAIWGIVIMALMLAAVVLLVYAVRNKSRPYQWLIRKVPAVQKTIGEIAAFEMSVSGFVKTTICSILIEFTGMAHIYISMLAVGLQPSLEAACVGYIVSVILLSTSPFLRGLGAVELSVTYFLTFYGYSSPQAFEITILYRIFEFWLPLALGILAFAAKGRSVFFRLFPAILIFLLGLVNILSALTPPILQRMNLLVRYIPIDTSRASNMFVLLLGVLLLVTAVFLVQGLRNAWLIALVISALSCISHLTKALDWEEASLSLFATLVLIFTYKQYRLKINSKLLNIGIITGLTVFSAVLVFGTIGFYFLQKRHFGVDFTWLQSIGYSLKSFFLLTTDELHPVTRFGKDFLMFMHILAGLTWVFFFYTFIRPLIQKNETDNGKYEEAQALLSQFGNSAVDYFKVYDDKQIFFSEEEDGFIAYRIASGFAIALEEPVCAEGSKISILEEFNEHCLKLGLKMAFYRVDEDSMYYFELLRMKKLLIGQEAVMDISTFTLEGREKKSLRNGLNSLSKKGYITQVYKAPLSNQLTEELKLVSDEWLKSFDKNEVVFSQGLFHRRFIRENDIIGIRDSENKLVAFLNVIPDYAPEECTYDLIRKTAEAPGGCMDALIVELAKYGKDNGYRYLNLGLVPMAGIVTPESPAERVVKFAYEKIKRFQHYQGLHDFKSKYASEWLNKYLVYQNDFDLIQLPGALSRVMQPPQKNYVT